MDPTTVTAIGRASLVPRGKNSTPFGGAGPRLPAPGSLHVPPVCERLPGTGRHAPASAGGDAEFPTQDTRPGRSHPPAAPPAREPAATPPRRPDRTPRGAARPEAPY